MTPRQQAEHYYKANPGPPSLRADIYRHRAHGVAIDTPRLFLLARPVQIDCALHQITDTAFAFEPMFCDCWHIQFLAGEMAEAFNFAPYPLPLVSMERHRAGRSRLVILEFKELRRLVTCASLPRRHTATISAIPHE